MPPDPKAETRRFDDAWVYGHQRDLHTLEPYYSRHVSAMTTEKLHGKSDIAAELAWRDQRIAQLETQQHGLLSILDAARAKVPMGTIVYGQIIGALKALGHRDA